MATFEEWLESRPYKDCWGNPYGAAEEAWHGRDAEVGRLQARIDRARKLADEIIAEHEAVGPYAHMDMTDADKAFVTTAKQFLSALGVNA